MCPDGSVYKTHQFLNEEWSIVRESMYLLTYASTAVDLLQATKRVTPNLVMPVVARFAYALHKDTVVKYGKRVVLVTNEAVKEARELAYKDTCRRFFNELLDCKLEDFAVATLLDPRHKSFKFKFSEKWMRGKFSRKQAEAWAVHIYSSDWAPKTGSEDPKTAEKPKVDENVSNEASFLADDSDDEMKQEHSATEEVEAPVKDELREYLDLQDAKSDVDVQAWWREHQDRFPCLVKMARQFLAAPASTAGVERGFSAVTKMHSDLRKN
ncbi:hypothetical protein CYMTET_16053 [Cymbomonas tetramitiformis]|uniref:HAT C-terminal dimerisation domain-containing protein n=1 Tax=Cymbomonas tetramitiformis TaxID=36881 RepID=A0AAE0GDB0_9CHLO|nr:hypothetical protein CYMTET_16053 [Cymbomonas tetramitiformis]